MNNKRRLIFLVDDVRWYDQGMWICKSPSFTFARNFELIFSFTTIKKFSLFYMKLPQASFSLHLISCNCFIVLFFSQKVKSKEREIAKPMMRMFDKFFDCYPTKSRCVLFLNSGSCWCGKFRWLRKFWMRCLQFN